jgi:hypothetical protein
MTDGAATPPSQWCLVGNIVEERPYGEGGKEIRRGTKHFAPGAKVYCLPAVYTKFGGEPLFAIGRHRKSGRFISILIRPDWVTNLRAKLVYHPEVLRRIDEAIAANTRGMGPPCPSQEIVERYIDLTKGISGRGPDA